MNKSLFHAIRALRANPARTVLTTLGIVIGIATVIMVLASGAGFRSLVNAQLESYGTNTLFVETRVPPTTKNRDAGAFQNDQGRAMSPVAITSLKTRDLDNINRLPNVRGSYGMVVGQKVVSYRGVEKNVLFYGASASRFDIDKGDLRLGRFYTAAEEQGAEQVAILGANLADDLFGEDNPVGKLVRLGELNFTVIGVYNARGSLGNGEDDTLFIPLRTAQKKLLGIDHLLVAIVEVDNSDLSSATAEDIRLLLRLNHGVDNPDKDDFSVATQADALDIFNTIFGGITALLIAVAAISLIVGGVGIMNIMYVIATERTAEIGLKKSLGAKNSDILREFLTEAVLVTLLGGAIGIAAGAALGFLVSVIATRSGLAWTFSVPLYAIGLAFGVSAAIGIGFGVLPARHAAKLDPIEALRYE